MTLFSQNFVIWFINQYIEELDDIIKLFTLNRYTYYYRFNVRISKQYDSYTLHNAVSRFNIVHLLYPHKSCTDDLFKYTPNLKSITLSISNIRIDEILRNLNYIEYIDLSKSSSKLSEHFIKFVPTRWPHVTNIKYLICSKEISTYQICNMINLKAIDLHNNDIIGTTRCYYLYRDPYNDKNPVFDLRLTQLTHLILGHNRQIKDTHLQYFPNLTHLICQHNTYITDTGLTYVKRKLTYLDCGMNKNFTDVGVSQLEHLTYLNTGHSMISDHGISNLANLKYLYCKSLSNITLVGISHLPNLVHLCIYATIETVTNRTYSIKKSINHLVVLSNLKYVYGAGIVFGKKINKKLPHIVTSVTKFPEYDILFNQIVN